MMTLLTALEIAAQAGVWGVSGGCLTSALQHSTTYCKGHAAGVTAANAEKINSHCIVSCVHGQDLPYIHKWTLGFAACHTDINHALRQNIRTVRSTVWGGGGERGERPASRQPWRFGQNGFLTILVGFLGSVGMGFKRSAPPVDRRGDEGFKASPIALRE
jgi:hypothetical protein